LDIILEQDKWRKLIALEVRKDKGESKLSLEINQDRLKSLEKRMGKNILFTDRDHWSTDEIISAYRGKYRIEDTFKLMNHSSLAQQY